MSPDASVITPDLETTDTSTVDTPAIETPDITPEVDNPDTQDENTPEDPAAADSDGPAVVNGKLNPAVFRALSELAATNPKLAKGLKDLKRLALERDAISRVAPGGLKEIRELQSRLEQIGEPEAIAQTREELQYFSDLDAQFTAGDPRFVQAMIDTPEGQAGFLKLAPSMLDQWKTLAPEAHENYLAKQQFSSLMESRIDLGLMRMRDLLTDPMPTDPEGLERWRRKFIPEYNRLSDYYAKVAETSKKEAPAPQVKQAPQQDNSERDKLQKDRLDFDRQQFTTIASGEAQRTIESELSRIATSRKLTDTQKEAVRELAVNRLRAALGKIPGFNETASKHFAKRDRDGYLRHVQAAYRQTIPAVLKAAADAIVANKAVRQTAAPAVVPGRTATTATAKPSEGYNWVVKAPDKTEINFSRTSADMIRNGQAVLESGRRVQWKK